MSSIAYYDQNAESFYERTIDFDMTEQYQNFLENLPPKAHILDLGCGVGRDAAHFDKLGHTVVAIDGSEEMVKKTAQHVPNIQVEKLLFKQIDYCSEFDGVWASASLLHAPYDQLEDVLAKIHRALKPKGILFASFKYGSSQRDTPGRTFFDMNEESILQYLNTSFTPVKVWKSVDTFSKVAPSPAQAWLNLVAQQNI